MTIWKSIDSLLSGAIWHIFKRIFLNENVCISIKILLKFVPKDPINNIP